MTDIHTDLVTHVIVDIRDADDGDDVRTVRLTPKRNSWARMTLDHVTTLVEYGAVPGSSTAERYAIRSVTGRLRDQSEVDVTAQFLCDGWSAWLRWDRIDPASDLPTSSPERDARIAAAQTYENSSSGSIADAEAALDAAEAAEDAAMARAAAALTEAKTAVVAAPVQDIIIEGVRLAWRDGDDWIVRMPLTASRAQVKAVNTALGVRRFWRNGCLWLDGKHFSEVVRLKVAAPVQAEAIKPVAVAA